jgi:hypothetical protein
MTAYIYDFRYQMYFSCTLYINCTQTKFILITEIFPIYARHFEFIVVQEEFLTHSNNIHKQWCGYSAVTRSWGGGKIKSSSHRRNMPRRPDGFWILLTFLLSSHEKHTNLITACALLIKRFALKAYGGCIYSRIIDIGSSRKWVVSFQVRQL